VGSRQSLLVPGALYRFIEAMRPERHLNIFVFGYC
jgi:hypothetical protein